MTIDVNNILNAISNFVESGKAGEIADKAVELFDDSTTKADSAGADSKKIIWDCIEMVAGQSGETSKINEENFGQTADLITNLIGNSFGGTNEITQEDAKGALNEVITLLKENGQLTSNNENYSRALNTVSSAFNAYLASNEEGSIGEIVTKFVGTVSKDENLSALLKENGADLETVQKSAKTASTNIIGGVFSTGFKLIGNLLTGAGDVLSGKSTLKDAAQNFLDTSANDVKKLGNTVTSNIGNFFNTVFGGISKVADSIFEDVESFVENSGIGDFLKDTVVTFAKSAIKNGIKNVGLIGNPEAFIIKTLKDTITDKSFVSGVTANFKKDVIARNADNKTVMVLAAAAEQYGPQILGQIQNFAQSA